MKINFKKGIILCSVLAINATHGMTRGMFSKATQPAKSTVTKYAGDYVAPKVSAGTASGGMFQTTRPNLAIGYGSRVIPTGSGYRAYKRRQYIKAAVIPAAAATAAGITAVNYDSIEKEMDRAREKKRRASLTPEERNLEEKRNVIINRNEGLSSDLGREILNVWDNNTNREYIIERDLGQLRRLNYLLYSQAEGTLSRSEADELNDKDVKKIVKKTDDEYERNLPSYTENLQLDLDSDKPTYTLNMEPSVNMELFNRLLLKRYQHTLDQSRDRVASLAPEGK